MKNDTNPAYISTTASPPDSVEVTRSRDRQSYVRVRVDGKLLVQGYLYPEPTESVRARAIEVVHRRICDTSPEECQGWGGRCVKAVDELGSNGLLSSGE